MIVSFLENRLISNDNTHFTNEDTEQLSKEVNFFRTRFLSESVAQICCPTLVISSDGYESVVTKACKAGNHLERRPKSGMMTLYTKTSIEVPQMALKRP